MKRDNLIVLTYLILTTVLTIIDVMTGIDTGCSWRHAVLEVGLIILGLIISFYYLRKLSRKLNTKANTLAESAHIAQKQASELKKELKNIMEGLSRRIDDQLAIWGLTTTERQVAFMLLKGLSLKDIASIRGSTEKTIRQHSSAIYRKSKLGGRAELSGYFLEDLLPPMKH